MRDTIRAAQIALREAKEAMRPDDPESIDRWLRADWELHARIQRWNHRPAPPPYVPYDWPVARAARKSLPTGTEEKTKT